MRKKVVGEEYVAGALEKGSSDFMRPLQQFATVRYLHSESPTIPFPPILVFILITQVRVESLEYEDRQGMEFGKMGWC